MTSEEKRDYNKLPAKYRDYYDFQKSLHPQWDHLQLMKRVGFQINIDGFIEKGGIIEDPPFWEAVIKSVDKWFNTSFPNLYPKVKDVFKKALMELTDMIMRGVKAIGDWLERLLNSL